MYLVVQMSTDTTSTLLAYICEGKVRQDDICGTDHMRNKIRIIYADLRLPGSPAVSIALIATGNFPFLRLKGI